MRTGIKPYLISAGLCMAVALPATAQQAGFYAGTSDDGNSVSFTVDEDGGDFTLTNSNVNFTAGCKKGDPASEGWGFFVGKPINDGKVNFVSSNDYYYTTVKVTFTSDTKLKGTIESRTAVFDKGNPPTDARYCISKKQNLSATFQGAAPGRALPAGAAVAFARPANATARILPELSR